MKITEEEMDQVIEFQDNYEQLKTMMSRGEIRASSLHADFYRKVETENGKYRTHAILVDVLE